MRALLVVGMAVLLGGCATTPEPRTITQVVKVPVPCEPQRPAAPSWAVDALGLDARIDEQMRALRADRQRARGYISELEAALNSCKN